VWVTFSSFSLQIQTTSPHLLQEADAFFSLTESYLDSYYRSATEFGPFLLDLRLSPRCVLASYGLVCTFRDGAVLLDSGGNFPPPPRRVLDLIHDAAFAEGQLYQYLHYLFAGGLSWAIVGGKFVGGNASAEMEKAAVDEGGCRLCIVWRLGVSLVVLGMFFLFLYSFLLHRRRSKDRKKSLEVVETGIDTFSDSVSSITTRS